MDQAAQQLKQAQADEEERKKSKPQIALADARIMVGRHFQVTPTGIAELDSYDDQNWKVVTDKGDYVFKAHNGVEAKNPLLLQAQTKLLERLHAAGVRAPRDAKPFIMDNGGAFRLLTWVDGEVLSKAVATPTLMRKSGAFLGVVRKALDDFDDEALHRMHLWDGRRFPAVRGFVEQLPSMGCDKMVHKACVKALDKFDAKVVPRAGELPMAVIHGDYNDANVLLDDEGEFGILDVGDAVHSWRVNDVAVGAAYVMVTLCTKENETEGFLADDSYKALEGARAFVMGVRSTYDLTAAELAALPYLVAARLATSFTMGWFSYKRSLEENPGMPEKRREYLLHHALPAGAACQMAVDAIEACGGAWISDGLTRMIHHGGEAYTDPRDAGLWPESPHAAAYMASLTQ